MKTKKRKKNGGASFVNNSPIQTIKVIKGSEDAISGHSATEYCNVMKIYYNNFIYKRDFNPIDNNSSCYSKPNENNRLELNEDFFTKSITKTSILRGADDNDDILVNFKKVDNGIILGSKDMMEMNLNDNDSGYNFIIDIASNILNNNGFLTDTSEWFIELHKYNITKDSFRKNNKKFFKSNRIENINNIPRFLNFGVRRDKIGLNENLKNKLSNKYIKEGLFSWHSNNKGAHHFDCHTIIFFFKKRPKDKVGGNFFYLEGDQVKKVKIEDNTIVCLAGNLEHSPGWIITESETDICRESMVIQIKKKK